MGNRLRFLGLAGSLLALTGLSQIAACTTDDTDSAAGAGGAAASTKGGATSTDAGGGTSASGGSTSAIGGSTSANGGSTSASGGNTSASGVCATPTLLQLTQPGIADFDAWDGTTPLSGANSWSFALGGDTSTAFYAGPFGYGDRTVGEKTDAIEIFDMDAGANGTKYALRIKDSMAQKYGGGMGLWLSGCLNATNFTGISFWVRGIAPTGKATLTVSMGDTTPTSVTNPGTCPGTNEGGESATCKHPTFEFPVTDTWTQIKAPWSGFKAGLSNGTAVTPNGRNITQLQLGIGLNWMPDAAGVYVATLAPYELVSDTWTFY